MIEERIPSRVIDIRAWRIRAGYHNMSEVARLIGYSDPSTFARMEQGERDIPPKRLALLEQLLGPDPPMVGDNEPEPHERTDEEFWTVWWEYNIELLCTQCGRYVWWPVKSERRVKIVRIPRIRCEACGAHVLASDITETRIHTPKPGVLLFTDAEKPKLGRPPGKSKHQNMTKKHGGVSGSMHPNTYRTNLTPGGNIGGDGKASCGHRATQPVRYVVRRTPRGRGFDLARRVCQSCYDRIAADPEHEFRALPPENSEEQ